MQMIDRSPKLHTTKATLHLVNIALCLLALLPLKTKAQQQVYPTSFTVAKDGSGDFKTIQEAVNAVRNFSQQQVTIHVKPGIYAEKVVVSEIRTNVYLKGENPETTIITNGDYSGKMLPVAEQKPGQEKYSTFNSYTVLVKGNDFKAENLTIINSAGPVGQAVALHVEADRCTIINCRLLGNQDTLYTGNDTSRQYYQNCWIEGTTDFIFGAATVVFQNCTLKSRANSYITAASTTTRQPYGYVFLNCNLIADSAATKVYLGRPWRPHARVVFIGCKMDKHILPAGWHNWGNAENEKTAFYAEYNNTGPGAAIDQRVSWSRQLSRKDAGAYTFDHIFNRLDGWVPAN